MRIGRGRRDGWSKWQEIRGFGCRGVGQIGGGLVLWWSA